MTGPARWSWRGYVAVLGIALLAPLAACGGSDRHDEARAPLTSRPPAATTATAAPLPPSAAACDGRPSPATYAHVVVVMLENRTWAKVGGPGFGPAMPVLRDLAARCAYYDQWEETNASQSSLTQYIGLTSGVDNTHTVNDCAPSRTCASSDDNIFRAVRQHGGTARSFVEDTVTVCSSGSNAARHIPALYYRGSYTDLAGNHTDADFCATEVQPLSDLDVDALPTFAFVTPNLCHDGHDCANDVVDDWLRDMLTALVGGADYHAGTTAIFVLWDEDGPTPNLLIAPSAQPGPRPGVGSHAAALKTMMLMLGLTPLPAVAAAPDLRPATPL